MWIEFDIDDDYTAREKKNSNSGEATEKKPQHTKYSQQIRYTIVERRKLCVMIIAKETNDNRIQI